MWVHNLNPVILDLGPLEIRWYGLVYVFGAVVAYLFLERARKKNKIDLEQKDISDLVMWLLIGVLFGSRFFIVLFYNLDYYLSQPLWKVIAVWEGGMSFHGGMAGITLAAYLFCRKKKISFLKVADLLSIPLIFVLALGRIANFINGELWGTVSNARWCIVFPAAGDECRHPYQLYEAAKRFLILGWLLVINRKSFKEGFIFLNLVFLEGLGRFILDFWKDEFTYWIFTPGQWMSLIMVFVAAYFLAGSYRKDLKGIFS